MQGIRVLICRTGRGDSILTRALTIGVLSICAQSVRASAQHSVRVEPPVRAELTSAAGDHIYVGVMLRAASRDVARERRARAVYVDQIQDAVLTRVDATDFVLVYRFENVPALTGWVNAAGLARLEADRDVLSIGLDQRGSSNALDDSVAFINADDVHSMGLTGSGMTVAVLDSGIDTDHPDLADNIAAGAFHFLGGGALTGAGAEDDYGHGTNVSGIITSGGMVAPPGVAPTADILAVKVIDASGSGFLSDWTAGVDYVVANQDSYLNLCAINMSLGSFALYDSCPCDAENTFNMALQLAIQAARDDGIPTFASSGNSGACGEMSAPACLSSAVAVAAVYDQALGREPDFGTYMSNFGSSFGACADDPTAGDDVTCFSNQSGCNELAAPGRRIRSSGLGGGTSTFTGTSQAAPHCAAVAALMCEKRALAGIPALSADAVITLMKTTGVATSDICPVTPSPIRIDALAAFNAVPIPTRVPIFGPLALCVLLGGLIGSGVTVARRRRGRDA